MNRVYLEGGIAREPQVTTTQSGKMVAKFSLGVKDSYGNKEETNWIDIVAWGKLAEATDGHGRGSQFFVAGRLTKRSYENKQGNTVYVTEVIADRVVPLSAPKNRSHSPADEMGEEVPSNW